MDRISRHWSTIACPTDALESAGVPTGHDDGPLARHLKKAVKRMLGKRGCSRCSYDARTSARPWPIRPAVSFLIEKLQEELRTATNIRNGLRVAINGLGSEIDELEGSAVDACPN